MRNWMQFNFWLFTAIVFYAFLGYGILLYVLVLIKRIFSSNKHSQVLQNTFEPEVTLVVPCFNEADILIDKINNCNELNYPTDKLKLMFITDGSTDNSADVLSKYNNIEVLHSTQRAGKTAAENRAMRFVKTPFVIFTDANTVLNADAIKNIVQHFANEKVGCVSGEKRIITDKADSASAAGEGIYWKYESLLKRLDSELYSAVGAAGELVAFRTSLYQDLPQDTLLDDFMQSMLIASKGYKIVYEPEAYAVETASANVTEELKRKIRICTGGWQSIERLAPHIKILKTPTLFFQYISHRVLRWTITPFLLILMFVLNIMLACKNIPFYQWLLAAHILFYAAATIGYVLENRKIRLKLLFVPYYFCVMNYAVLAGLKRYLSRKPKNGTWEKAARKSYAPVLNN